MILSFVRALISAFKARRELALENVALRQQLAVLHRSVKRPRLSNVDSEFWVVIRKKEDRSEAVDHGRLKTRNQRWVDFLRSTTGFAIGFTTSTPPSRANLRRYHRHQGRYCRITNTNKTDPARLEARIYLAMLGPIEQIL